MTYKMLTAAITASIESETAAHFSAAAEEGAVTVSVSEDAETEETAAIVFSAAGCEFKNRLEVTVASAMRRITVRMQTNTAAASPSPMPTVTPSPMPTVTLSPMPTVTLSPMPTVTLSPMPRPSISPQFEQVVKVVALDSGGGLLPGAVLVAGSVSGEPDAEGYNNFVIDIPRQTESVALIAAQKVVGAEENSSASAENAERFAIVLPFLGIPIGEEDTYTISEEDMEKYMFVNMEMSGGKLLKGRFGFYADDKFTEPLSMSSMSKSVCVGDKVYFCPEAENALGVKIICDKPISTDSGMFDYADGVLTAKKAGIAYFVYDWYGFTGLLSIFPSPAPSFVVSD